MIRTRKCLSSPKAGWSATKKLKEEKLESFELKVPKVIERLNTSTTTSSEPIDQELPRILKKRPKSIAWSKSEIPSILCKISSPIEILEKSSNFLNEYEKNEILNYPIIYYFGQKAQKVIKDYSDEDGYYQYCIQDHLANQYEIVSVLGRGEFSQVFNCIDHKTGGNFAVKVLRNGEIYRNSGEEECRILDSVKASRLNQDSVNLVVDQFEFRDHLCIVFRKLTENLFDFMNKIDDRRLEERKAANIIKQVLEALNCVHSLNFIHCDVKPENIMFKDEKFDKIGLIDFGSACEISRMTAEYVQSRPYRAPEIVIEVEYTNKIDMWSVGCLTVELLTGRQIFQSESELDLFKNYIEVCGLPDRRYISKGRRSSIFMDRLGKFKVKAQGKVRSIEVILDRYGKDLQDFVSKLIRWNPEERMSSKLALSHNWIKKFG